MNAVIIGLGSMGSRRIKILNQCFPSVDISGIDLNESRQKKASEQFGIETFSSLQAVLQNKKLDCAFVCTDPAYHSKIIMECLLSNINVFTELNLLSNNYDLIVATAKQNDLKIFLSSTMLYRKEIQYIASKVITSKEKLNYIYHVGQYLPDWHPWESFKNYFVGKKSTNGCREIFAVELPWIIKAFGKIKDFYVVKDRISNLDIDYNDNYLVTLLHESGHKGQIMLDVVARKAVRRLEVLGEHVHIFWNGTPDSLSEINLESGNMSGINLYESVEKNSNYSDNIVENAYVDEVQNFFDYLIHDTEPKYTFKEDYYTLKFIDQLETE